MSEMTLLCEWGQCCPSCTWSSSLEDDRSLRTGPDTEGVHRTASGGGGAWGQLIGRINLNGAAKDDGARVLRKLASEKAELAELAELVKGSLGGDLRGGGSLVKRNDRKQPRQMPRGR